MSDGEKRRHPRFTVEDVRGQVVLTSKVEVLNLGLGGVALRADRRLNIGSEYTLKLEMGDRFIALPGVVVWSTLSGLRGGKGSDAPQYSAGLRFTAALDDKIVGLMEFIDDNRIVEEHRLAGLRFELDAPGKAVLDGVEACRVRRISLGGMLIEAERSLDVERVYAMSFQTPRGERVALAGRVASCQADESGPHRFRIGIAFADLSPPDRARLDAFVRSLVRDVARP